MIVNKDHTILPVIGLEIHVQLATETKLFCRCRNHFGDAPNTNVCPVCLGLPGALPVINRKALELSIKVGLALNCKTAKVTKWDRKSYYYPDLPKNYQISQFDNPLNINGYLEIPVIETPDMETSDKKNRTKRIRILRAHLEEDAGKNSHDNPFHTGVDLNRAGIPLLEIVSEPDMNTSREVLFYSRTIHQIVRWLGAGEANMEKGHMRFEPNINLHITKDGKKYKTPIVEVKNLNSFKSLEKTIEYEIERQYGRWLEDPEGYTIEKLEKQNRGFDVTSGETVFQRGKEEAHDYRYFPEPDLVPVMIDEDWERSIQKTIGELPLEREERYRKSYNLTDKEISALTMDKATGDLLDKAIKAAGNPKQCANLLLGRGAALANQKNCSIARIGIKVEQLTELSNMLAKNEITATTSSKLFDRMVKENRRPMEIAQADGLLIEKDLSAIIKWIDETLAANKNAINDAINEGKKQKKAFGFLIGQVMQKSKGTAPPQEVKRILREKLGIKNEL